MSSGVHEDRWYTSRRKIFRQKLLETIEHKHARHILEIGANSHPLIKQEYIPQCVEIYTVSDIDADAVNQVPDGYDALVLDACGDISHLAGKYDVVFSYFCAEHVKDGMKFHSNIHKLLAPGGVALHFIPTLFASPFVINWLLPENFSSKFLGIFKSDRYDAESNNIDKWPAHYAMCRGSKNYYIDRISDIGFKNIDVHPFYGHNYYSSIPVVREVDDFFSKWSARRGWSFYTSYAMLTAEKVS